MMGSLLNICFWYVAALILVISSLSSSVEELAIDNPRYHVKYHITSVERCVASEDFVSICLIKTFSGEYIEAYGLAVIGRPVFKLCRIYEGVKSCRKRASLVLNAEYKSTYKDAETIYSESIKRANKEDS
tara:strand:+ start:68 stop:457 length:390 start_codon:yes stop_codon:yes gene_type:complete